MRKLVLNIYRNDHHIDLEINIDSESNFYDYLMNKLRLYPLYIQNSSVVTWFRKKIKFTIVSNLENKAEDCSISINEKIKIPLSTRQSNEKCIEELVELVFSWLEEEYRLYQTQWKEFAKI